MAPRIRHLSPAALALGLLILPGLAHAGGCGPARGGSRYVYSGPGTGYWTTPTAAPAAAASPVAYARPAAPAAPVAAWNGAAVPNVAYSRGSSYGAAMRPMAPGIGRPLSR